MTCSRPAPAPKAGIGQQKSGIVGVLAGLIVLTCTLSAEALQTVTLGWEPSPAPIIAGYKVYWGQTSGQYDHQLSVANITSASVPGLQEGSTYYFVVTAYDIAGLESLPSNEVAYTVPGTFLSIRRIELAGFPNAFFVSATGAIPIRWTLEASENLQTWRALTRGTNAEVNVTVITHGAPVLFFRLKAD